MRKLKQTTVLQSGRSMVEMLGVLAVIGVLSIGGIAGYSYGMDKYRANETMNDVNLRSIDLIAQISRGGDLSLAEWPTKTVSDYDIGLEVDTATNTTEGGIYVDKVPQRVCEIMADSIPDNIELTVNGVDYTGSCGETNKMVFYYEAVSEALGETCNGPIVEGVCQPCGDDKKWNASVGECLCADSNKFLSGTTCKDCPCNATVSDDGMSCVCPEGYEFWVEGDGICWKSLAENACPVGKMRGASGGCLVCEDIGAYYHSCEKGCICKKGTIMGVIYGTTSCFTCPAEANQYDENGICLCPDGKYPHVDDEGGYCD